MEISELKRRTFHSVLWTAARIGLGNVLSFVVFWVLARVLNPTTFGVFVLASVILELAKIISAAGLGDALVQVASLDEELADSAFWANLAFGTLVGAIMGLLAPTFAHLVGEPEVRKVLECLSALVPVSSLGAMHIARTLREFGHRSVAARAVASGAIGGGAAIIAAVQGFGVWSLVVQIMVSDVVGTLLAWNNFPWVPRLRLRWSRLAEIAGFSGNMMLTQLLFALLVRAQDLIIGTFLTAAAVGTYRIAWRMLELITQATLFPITTVSNVTLARLQHDRTGFANAYGRMLGLAALLTLPAIFGFGVLSDSIIVTLFGAKWAASAFIAKILALMAPAYILNFFMGPAMAAAGRSRASLRVSCLEVTTALLMSAACAPFGLTAATLGYVLSPYVTMPYRMLVLKREIGIGSSIIMRNMLPPLLASAFMVICLLIAVPVMNQYQGSRVLHLAMAIAVGAVAYAAGLLIFGFRFVALQYSAIRPLLMPIATAPTSGPSTAQVQP